MRPARARAESQASSDVDRLLTTVGKLAELVGAMAANQKPEAKAAVSEILEAIKPIADRSTERSRVGSTSRSGVFSSRSGVPRLDAYGSSVA